MAGIIEEGIMVGGLALIPVISVLVSIIKVYWDLTKHQIALLNVLLGALAITMWAVFEGSMGFPQALTYTLGVVVGSKVFHDTFGHAMDAVMDLLGKYSSGIEKED